MTDEPDKSVALLRIRDFQAALLAGLGFSNVPDPNKRGETFGDCLKSGKFAESGLYEVASTLMGNIQRLRSQARLPLAMFLYGRTFQEAYSHICDSLGRSPYLPQAASSAEIQAGADMKVYYDIEVKLKDWILGIDSYETTIGQQTSYFHVAGGAASSVQEFHDAIQGFCSSLVVQGWTTFETLSEDLWEAALNSHPTVLAVSACKGGVSFDALQSNSFNVQSKLGTILKSKVGFRSLAAIQEAYKDAFEKHGKGVLTVLSDPGLKYASALRNILVHKRGIVDKDFHVDVAGLDDVPKVAIGDQFPLTGSLAATLSDRCCTCSMWLVNAVHAWIIGHSKIDGI